MIRRATVEDAAEIARIHVAAWQFAYEDIVPGEELAALSVDERADVWRRRLGEGVLAWVSEVDGRIYGFASVTDGMLTTLYVDPMAQGAGVGTELLAEAEAAGARVLEVFAANGHARRFYEGRGWRAAGDADEILGQPVVRYVRC